MKQLFTLFFACLIFYHTNAQGLALPYYTGFDSSSERAGWQQFRTGFQSTYSWTNLGALSHDYNVGGNATDTVIDWYVSPALHFAYPGSMSFKIMTSGFSTPIPDNCEVWFGVDDPNPATGNFTLLANLSYMQPQYQWLDTTVAVPFTAENAYIAFKYKTIGAAWMTYAIDSITVSEAVGIKEISQENKLEIKVGPNPISGVGSVFLNKKIENCQLQLFTISGELVKELNAINGQQIAIDGSTLPSGTYIVKISKGTSILGFERFVVLH